MQKLYLYILMYYTKKKRIKKKKHWLCWVTHLALDGPNSL